MLQESKDRLVIEQRVRVRNPRREFGKVIVADGYLAVWFIFRGRWYDVGKFYDRKGEFTGYYCDIIRPVSRLLANASKTSFITDLFLDLWISREGRCVPLDEDDLNRAFMRHIISPALAKRARRELRNLIHSAESGRFPTGSIRNFQPTMKWFRS